MPGDGGGRPRRGGWRRWAGYAALAVGVLATVPAAAQDIWFGAVSNLQAPRGFTTNPDYPDLFSEQTRWPRGLARVRVFKVPSRYVMTAPEADVRRMFAFLRAHNIAVAAVLGMVEAEGCGKRIEGMAHGPNQNMKFARRYQELGADVRYIDADEPLTFGHYFDKRDACRYSVEETADSFADNVRRVKSVFPNATVVDTEATTNLEPEELDRWFDLLREKLGPDAPSLLHLDVQWQRPGWEDKVRRVIDVARAHGLRYGIIYHGTAQDRSDEAYMADVKANIVAWERAVREPPATVIIQSWTQFPSHVLPENDPTALSSLVTWYCEHATLTSGCK